MARDWYLMDVDSCFHQRWMLILVSTLWWHVDSCLSHTEYVPVNVDTCFHSLPCSILIVVCCNRVCHVSNVARSSKTALYLKNTFWSLQGASQIWSNICLRKFFEGRILKFNFWDQLFMINLYSNFLWICKWSILVSIFLW